MDNNKPATAESKSFSPFDCNRTAWVAATLVALATLIVYLPALQNGFVNWDDDTLVYENPTLRSIDIPFIGWALTDISTGLWHPILWLSFALDYTAWGLNPSGYHLTNTILHSINTLLVFIVVTRLLETGGYRLGKKALIVVTVTTLLFGIHPLHVESVAWVTERKDVLYSFFFLLSINVYLRYASTNLKRYYLLSLILFILSLMSKPMAVSLPAVLLILDFYPLKRLTWEGGVKKNGGVLVEKLPFLLIGILLTALTVWVHPGFESQGAYPLKGRIFMATHSLISYLGKIALPFNLAPIYPNLSIAEFFSFEYIRPFIGLTAIIIIYIWPSKRSKIFSAICLYYTATLMPVLGQVGAQAGVDRYTYLPSIGVFLLLGLGVGYLSERCSKKQQAALAAALIFMFGALISKTITQIAVWKDSVTLWSRMIAFSPYFAEAYTNRGGAHVSLGSNMEALKDLNIAIGLDPGSPKAYLGRGIAYGKSGNYQETIKDYSKAIELGLLEAANHKEVVKAFINRGDTYMEMGQYQLAIKDFDKAIALDPLYADGYYNRGNVYRSLGENRQAINNFSMAIRLNPRHPKAYNNRGNIYSKLGEYQQALEDYSMAMKLNPNDAIAYKNMLVSYGKMSNSGQAMKDFQKMNELNYR